MNRVLEKVFPTFSRHARPRTYFTYPEGSTASSVVFRVRYAGNDAIRDGRVVLFFAPTADAEPRFEAFDLDSLKPMFSKDVANVAPGDVIEFDSSEYSLPGALAFVPNDLSVFDGQPLVVQALFNQNLDDPDANSCVGNHYSKPQTVSLSDVQSRTVEIVADQVISEIMDTSSSEWMECVQMRSELLSDYHNQDVYMYAAVVLPKDFHAHRAAGVKFPTLYYIEGFTGTESYADRGRAFLDSPMGDDWKAGKWPTPMLRVTLGSRFKFGHTSFADSESNGPWGTALVSEFIPYLESQFPMIAASGARLLHGHSSGGWSSLWLQVQFPDFFGGTWSTAPDPVSFSSFQIVNIYEAENMFWDPYGQPFPVSRQDGDVTCTIRNENLVEHVFARGNGGQWDAFFALFGPRDNKTNLPVPLFDKLTGAINRDVVEYWKRFDICKILEARGAEELAGRLKNKIHVICGTEDNYYLNGACETLKRLVGSKKPTADGLCLDNYVDMVPGDHTSIRNRQHYATIHHEIALALRHSGHA
ncbi:hypothetical protein ATCC90586_011521 [Pythium insidiosum]|nr:hypothetical protein ATCC90586_011521 [Pythium insidiosum]